MASNSNPSSEVSIEEIGPEEVSCTKEEDAEEIVTADDKKTAKKEEEEEGEKPTADSGDNNASSGAARLVVVRRATDEDLDDDDEEDDFEDETLYERLVGLTEMFPEYVRTGACALASGGVSGTKWLYSSARTVTWVFFTTVAIGIAPVVLEAERFQYEEAQKQKHSQILLGPGAAISGGMAAAGQQNAPLPPPAM